MGTVLIGCGVVWLIVAAITHNWQAGLVVALAVLAIASFGLRPDLPEDDEHVDDGGYRQVIVIEETNRGWDR